MLLFCKIRSTAVELQLTKVQPAEMSGFSRAARGPLVSVNPSVTSQRLVGNAFRAGGWEKPATNSWARTSVGWMKPQAQKSSVPWFRNQNSRIVEFGRQS